MTNKRYMLVILGSAKDIEQDLNFVADGEKGVHFVDGRDLFICTFYSPYSTSEIHEKLAHRPAMILFDISENETYAVNLPSKYYLGLFPEYQKDVDTLFNNKIQERKTPPEKFYRTSSRPAAVKVKMEEFTSVDEILDKLSRNNYDRSCLTEKEKEILNKG